KTAEVIFMSLLNNNNANAELKIANTTSAPTDCKTTGELKSFRPKKPLNNKTINAAGVMAKKLPAVIAVGDKSVSLDLSIFTFIAYPKVARKIKITNK